MRRVVDVVACILLPCVGAAAYYTVRIAIDFANGTAWGKIQSDPVLLLAPAWLAVLTICLLYLGITAPDETPNVQIPELPALLSTAPPIRTSQPWISTSEEPELKGATEAMATADERWVAYRDVSLWSSPELGAGHEIVRLNRGDLVKVLDRGTPGMAEVRTEDLRHGWVRTIELTDYRPNLESAESQAVVQTTQPQSEMVAAPVPYYDPSLDVAMYSSVHGGGDGEGVHASEPVQAAGGFFHGILDAIGNAFSSIGDAIGDIDFGDFDGGDFGGFD